MGVSISWPILDTLTQHCATEVRWTRRTVTQGDDAMALYNRAEQQTSCRTAEGLALEVNLENLSEARAAPSAKNGSATR